MSKHYRYLFIILLLGVSTTAVLVYALSDNKLTIDRYSSVGRPARIRPDYSGMVIPPNIAPLNFLVQEKAIYYCVKIYSKKGKTIEVFSPSPKIVIPIKPWRKLLNKNKGRKLYFEVFVKTQNGQWNLFSTITNNIAPESIDGFLVYRKIHPVYSHWRKMGIYQRDLHSYDESLVLDNEHYRYGCINCHTFYNNRTDRMLISIRSDKYGSSAILVKDDTVNKIGTKFGYTAWHPSGQMMLYSINMVRQFFHSARNEVRDVVDLDSLLAYYLVDSETVKTSPKISKKDRLETYPTWSPDGRYLYFCSAPMLWSNRDKVPPLRYRQIKYDLLRISYDLEHDRWGQPETVLSTQDTALCILMPRISPDGRWLLFCMCNYGSFPAYQKSSDLYLIDLKAARETSRYEYRRLNINSNKSESWHSWSSNSRWIAFSSKRRDDKFTRIYLSYVDENGSFHKPILLPQKDPTFYDSCLKTYSVPELVIQPVQVTPEKLGRVVRSHDQIPDTMPITMATPKAGPPSPLDPWQQRE